MGRFSVYKLAKKGDRSREGKEIDQIKGSRGKYKKVPLYRCVANELTYCLESRAA